MQYDKDPPFLFSLEHKTSHNNLKKKKKTLLLGPLSFWNIFSPVNVGYLSAKESKKRCTIFPIKSNNFFNKKTFNQITLKKSEKNKIKTQAESHFIANVQGEKIISKHNYY